jgi:hypothetical protein
LAFWFQQKSARRGIAITGMALGIASLALLASAASPSDNPTPSDSVGSIEGPYIAVSGPMSVDTVNGQIITTLRSGSDVRVKSGTAAIKLLEGGQISICGPAHFSVLKSGNSLTIALDTGTIHAHIEHQPTLTIYTPQIQAQSVAIGDAAQDTIVGFDATGAMCIRANRGALRLEQQLTGQNVLVPQGGDVFLSNGQIDSLQNGSGTHCDCELQLVEAPQPSPEVSPLATEDEIRSHAKDVKPNVRAADPQKTVPAADVPIYQVYVPPLIFDAKARVQPEVDPKMIVLIRRVHVRPTLIFQGKVESDLVAVKAPVPDLTKSSPPVAPKPALAAPAKPNTLTDKVRTLVHKLWP